MSGSSSLPSNTPTQFTHQISITLSSDNYLLWKSQIIPVLRGHGIISFLSEKVVIPEEFVTSSDAVSVLNPEFDKWQKQDQLILVWLFNSISPQILAQVINCETTSQLWQHLHQIYNSQSLAKILELKLKIQTIKKGEDSCTLQKFQAIADQLRSVGSDVSEQDLVLFILQGLGFDYESFVTAISMRQGLLTMSELHSLLLSHEARLLTSHPASSPQNAHLNTGQFHPNQVHATQQLVISGQYQGRGRGRYSYRGRGSGRNLMASREDLQC
jgi:gag-polypeptide of LTR copia-type